MINNSCKLGKSRTAKPRRQSVWLSERRSETEAEISYDNNLFQLQPHSDARPGGGMVYTTDLKSVAARLEGSSPSLPTILQHAMNSGIV